MKHALIVRRRTLTLLLVLITTALLGSAAWAVTLEEEIDLGNKLNREILKQTPAISDKKALKEIDELGQALAKNVRRPEIKYHFTILRGEDFNAFSIPGGYVYFSDRLWKVMRRDERIGVLAHEIVHSDRRHALDAMLKAQRRSLWIAVLLTAANANNTWANLADMAHQLYTLKYSRGDERQADEVGVELCVKAGFNPAGLLLAMRKINRFNDERGGEPPKIFSSHPPTQERLDYLTKLLQSMNVPIPPEDVKDAPAPYKVGEVATVQNQQISFVSSKPLGNGTVIWLMGSGWDYYYETRTGVPIARGIVTSGSASTGYNAAIWPMPSAKKGEIAKGAVVFAPPAPKAESGVGSIESRSHQAQDIGSLNLSSEMPAFTRLLARQVVWNNDYTKLVYDGVGYVVLTAPSKENRFIATSRPRYLYAPIAEDSLLVKLTDPEQKRWFGPVVSIGRSGNTIELVTSRSRDELTRARNAGKRFDVLYPAWNPSDNYESRVVGTAVVKSMDKKIVLTFDSFRAGWGIGDIQNGFDIYIEPTPKPQGLENSAPPAGR